MTYYGGKELAAAFRTVRANTIKTAEEIPESKYDFRAAPDCRNFQPSPQRESDFAGSPESCVVPT